MENSKVDDSQRGEKSRLHFFINYIKKNWFYDLILIILFCALLIPKHVCTTEYVDFKNFGENEDITRINMTDTPDCRNYIEFVFKYKKIYEKNMMNRLLAIKSYDTPFEAYNAILEAKESGSEIPFSSSLTNWSSSSSISSSSSSSYNFSVIFSNVSNLSNIS